MPQPDPPEIDSSTYTPPPAWETFWAVLCEDVDANVVVLDCDARLLYANDAAARWIRWHIREHGGLADRVISESSPGTHPLSVSEERLRLGREVMETGRSITYESVYHGMRARVTMRQIPAGNGTNHLLLVSRRMRPWERASDNASEDLSIVETQTHEPGDLGLLTERELEVLILIGEGLSYAEIAARLHRSVRTIERHRDRIGHKLGTNNRSQLTRIAIRAGLCELPTPPEQEMLEETGFDPLDLSGPMRSIAHKRGTSGK